MNEQIMGRKIRELRLLNRVSLTDLARKSGITKSNLSKIENGQISSPVSTLLKIADSLQVPISEFFIEEGKHPPFVLTRKGKGPVMSRDGTLWGYSYEALASGMRGKLGEPFLLTIRPGDPVGEFQHGGQEFIYMLSGKLKFTIGGKELLLSPGDSLYLDPTHAHKTEVSGRETVRFICIFMQSPIELKEAVYERRKY